MEILNIFTNIQLSLVGLVVIGIVFYFTLKNIYKKKYMEKVEYLFFIKTNKYREHTLLTSIFLTYTSMSIYIIISSIFKNKEFDYIETSILTISMIIGIYSLLMTLNIFEQQKEQISNFDDLLSEIINTFLLTLEKVDNQLSSDKVFDVYIYGYHPLLGILSSTKKYNEYKNLLERLKKNNQINLNIICYHEDSIETFFEGMSFLDESKKLTISNQMRNYIHTYETNEHNEYNSKTSLWKAKYIDQFHFFIIDDIAFQYIVLPKEYNRNVVYGFRTEDSFVIDFLIDTYQEKQSKLLQIKNIKHNQQSQLYEFYINSQSNISNVIIYDSKGNEGAKINNHNLILGDKSNVLIGFKINEKDIKTFPFRFKLVKSNNESSQLSKSIFYHQLINSQKESKKVKYITPNLNKPEKINNCIEELNIFSKKYKVLKVTIFYNNKDINYSKLYDKVEKFIFPIDLLPTQPNGGLISCEVIYLNNQSNEVIYKKDNGYKCALVEFKDRTEYFVSNFRKLTTFSEEIDCSAYIQDTKNSLKSLYNFINKNLKLSTDNIIRQWNYIGNINQENNVGNKSFQCYQIFNEIRFLEFKEKNFTYSYPVATAIGMENKNFFLSLFLIKFKNNSEYKVTNLTCSSQKNPYEYSDKVLIGDSFNLNGELHPPLFERGKKITSKYGSTQYIISGMASITGEESNDENTLSQLESILLSLKDILNEKNEKNILISNFSYMRIYYTKKNDLSLIETFLNPLLKDTPHIYLLTNMCRKNLYIEIEAARF